MQPYTHTNNNIFDPMKMPTKMYNVRVPIIATYTDEEMAIYGLPVNMDRHGKPEMETYQELTVVMMNIDKMIDTYISGYPIALTSIDQAKEVFDTLETYLKAHVDKVQVSINQPVKQDPRLGEIDRFLSEVFEFNRTTIVNQIVKDTENIGGFNLGLGTMNQGTGVTGAPVNYGVGESGTVGKVGLAAAYEQPTPMPYTHGNANQQQQPQHMVQRPAVGNVNPLIQPNQLHIDPSLVERTSMLGTNSIVGDDDLDLNDLSFDLK